MNSEYFTKNIMPRRLNNTAKFLLAAAIILGAASIAAGCFFLTKEDLVFFALPFSVFAIISGLLIIVGGVALSCALKGFAVLIAQTGEVCAKAESMESSVTSGLAAAVRKEQAYRAEQARLEELERARQAEAKRKAAEEVQKQLEQARLEAQQAKQARIDKYWAEHKEEYDELIDQRADAEDALSKPDGLTDEEKKELEDFIAAVDRRLTKDRPEIP